ncbi:MAG: outer membrane protein assembly factor BamD [Acidobacteriota bacterium]|nr:outer membrane protein assembly factor BamD [Acidobacteriota bacterium]
MYLDKYKAVLLSLVLIAICAVFGMAQKNKEGQGSVTQRLDVMRQKLETTRRSLESAAAALKEENKDDKAKKDDKASLETPLGRLRGLGKESATLQSEVNSLRGKVDRSEKYEVSEVDQLETSVGELQTRADTALTETASARANPTSAEGTTREVKKKKKFLGIFGGGADEYEDLLGTVVQGRDRELFVAATKEVRKNNYDVGRLLFQTIITTYPDSSYLPMAKLAVADSFYLEGSTSALIQAAAAYQEWLTFFPTHPLADRVLLKVAESEMRQIGLPDRDSTRARRAEQRLRALLQQYPNTDLKAIVGTRLEEVQDNLGLHNLYIANYYYTQAVNQKKGGLKGAQSRLREILDKYPHFSFMDEALFKLAVTYQIEEETDQAAKYFQQLVRDYPNSDYVEKAKEQLNVIGATVPESNPDRMKVLPPEKKSFIANFRNELFGLYPLTIDKDGVLMTDKFDKTRFELIDQVIKNKGELNASEIPKSLTTVVSQQKSPKETEKTVIPQK